MTTGCKCPEAGEAVVLKEQSEDLCGWRRSYNSDIDETFG